LRKIIVAVVILAVLGFGASRTYDWWSYNVNTPVAPSSQPVVFHIDRGELPAQVADDLQTKRLIRSRDVFEWYVRITGIGSHFQAGAFRLNRNMNMVQIADALQRGNS
jgi:UPF0755 protein